MQTVPFCKLPGLWELESSFTTADMHCWNTFSWRFPWWFLLIHSASFSKPSSVFSEPSCEIIRITNTFINDLIYLQVSKKVLFQIAVVQHDLQSVIKFHNLKQEAPQCKTRGPRGPWVAHLRKRSKVTVEPIIENPRGIIWTNLVEDLFMMLYIKYESTGPCSSRQEDFESFILKPIYWPCDLLMQPTGTVWTKLIPGTQGSLLWNLVKFPLAVQEKMSFEVFQI